VAGRDAQEPVRRDRESEPALTSGVARLGVTVGDPAGIGPEVVAAALREIPPERAHLCVYGDVEAVAAAGGPLAAAELHPFQSARVEPGRPDPRAAEGVIEAVRAATRDCLAGALDALVTAPLSKDVIARAGYAYPGHTELIEEVAGRGRAVMLLVGGSLRVALATIHCALREVPARLAAAGLDEILRVLDTDLRRRFAVPAPRIAVCGLNPHAGEAGRFGDEEARLIAPAVERARAAGLEVRGPFSADSLFARAVRGEFDAVLAMYHDQGLGPLKTHAFGRAVNVTLGLPLIRTSVDHGTAFDIAGRGLADPGSLLEAIDLALALSRNERRAARAKGG
jgi:4-hydroxythreonine-4-phosphate dehydrogenase